MNQRLDELCKEMNNRNSGELAGVAPCDSLGEHTAVKSQKILSEDTAHYILIKNNGQAAEKDQQEIGNDKITQHGIVMLKSVEHFKTHDLSSLL